MNDFTALISSYALLLIQVVCPPKVDKSRKSTVFSLYARIDWIAVKNAEMSKVVPFMGTFPCVFVLLCVGLFGTMLADVVVVGAATDVAVCDPVDIFKVV